MKVMQVEIFHMNFVNSIKAYNRSIWVQDYQPVRGRYRVPDAPGLGVDLNPEVLSRAARIAVP